MSYDVRFVIDRQTVDLDQPADLRGGTYAIGGTTEAWLNITYNYGGAFRDLFGEKGLRELYGKRADDLRMVLDDAIKKVPALEVQERPCHCHQTLSCYWAVTRKNVASALKNLRTLAGVVPDEAVLQGD